MIGIALRHARQAIGITQKELGRRHFVSGSMVNEIEHGRKKLPRDVKPEVARGMDDGALYMAIARDVTGGVMMGPYLNNVDDHRIVGVLKCQEEMQEALELLQGVMPILLRAKGPKDLRPGETEKLKGFMLEMIEASTAAQNNLARLAKIYDISLADLWDEHEADLIQKGYLVKGD